MSDAYVVGPLEARRSPFLELEQPDWDAMVAEIRSAFLGARDYARGRQGGRIVVVSAAAAARPIAGAALEGVAGAFLTTAAQVAAAELAERGITANVVVPALEPDGQAVDAVVAFLLSDDARGVTGAVIAADGGFSITKQSTPSPLLDERA
ncbi:MAG TPA: SDR family oxidoreductase [Gaiellaceae bacterium]|nr:SDR family oxidoreductase [Gaiellaceae bacterium]